MFSPPVTAAIVLGAFIFSVYQYFKSSPNSHYEKQYPPQQYSSQQYSSQEYSSQQCRNRSLPNEDYGCTICLGTEEGKKIRLACLHIFHKECLRGWFSRERSCPNCRQEM